MVRSKILRLISSIVVFIVIINPLVIPVTYTLAETLPLSYTTVENEDLVVVEESVATTEEVVEALEPQILSDISNSIPQTVTDTKIFTVEALELNKVYAYPLNSNVTITFTQLPEGTNTLSIREVTLSEEEIATTGAVSSIAYEFLSNMVNGTFTYNLTLPNPTNSNNVEVKYSEDLDTLSKSQEIQNEVVSTYSLSINGLNHFTVFYVVNPNPAGPGNTSNDNCATVTIAGSQTCYSTIQAAVDAAALNNVGVPHTINIAPGTYTETVVVSNDPQLDGLTINGSGIDSTIIVGRINIVGGLDMDSQTVKNLTLRGAPGVARGLNIAYDVKGFTIDTIKMENYENFALSLDNNGDITGLTVKNSQFLNNQIALKSSTTTNVYRSNPITFPPAPVTYAPGTYSFGMNFLNNIVDGGTKVNSLGIYVAGEEAFIPAFGNPLFDAVGIEDSLFSNLTNAVFLQVASNVTFRENIFLGNVNSVILSKTYKNGSSINNIQFNTNLFGGNANTNYFIKIDARDQSIVESGPTEGVGKLFFLYNEFVGANIAAIALGQSYNDGFKNPIYTFNATLNANSAFFENAFESNTLDIIYNIPSTGTTFDLDARTTTSWSGGNPFSNINSVEKKLVHDCTNSPYLKGDCNNNDNTTLNNDFGLGIGSIRYTDRIYTDVVNFSLEESNQSITVRWPEVIGAEGYRIFYSTTNAGVQTALPINVIGCPDTGANPINACEYKISGLTNATKYFVNIKAELTDFVTTFNNPNKFATPFSVIIDDDAQFAQEGINVGLFTPYNYRAFSTLRGSAANKSDDLYDGVGEDKYDFEYNEEGTFLNNLGIWQTGVQLNGYYDVYATFQNIIGESNSFSSASDVQYSLIDADTNTKDAIALPGSNLNVNINQRLNENGVLGTNQTDSGWIKLGSYFYDNAIGYVSISGNTASGMIQMDAIAFQPNTTVDVVPQASIIAAPGESTTAQAITLSAVITGGNSPTSVVSWGNGNFSGCTGSTNSIVTPSIAGTYTCTLTVRDLDGDLAQATKSVIVNEAPVVSTDISPTVVLFGNAPAANSGGNVLAAANTNFTITSSLSNLGNPNYNYAFGNICSGSINNSSSTSFTSNVLNLATGNYVCTISVTDTDGDVALASVNVIVGSGVGAAGPQVQGVTTTTQPVDNTNTEDVLGATDAGACTTFEDVSGYVFKDTVTVNNRKENAESGLEGIGLTIFTFNEEGEEVVVTRVTTNRIGFWEADLCAGTYNIRINRDDLPDNTVTGGSDTFSFSVLASEDKKDVNFAIYDVNTAGFNWWILLLILLIILLGVGGYIAYNSRRTEQSQ